MLLRADCPLGPSPSALRLGEQLQLQELHLAAVEEDALHNSHTLRKKYWTLASDETIMPI